MLYQSIGWTGTVLFIVSYGLLSVRKLQADTIRFQAMNALGALCLVINAIHIGDNPTLVVNAMWMGISIYAMIMAAKKRAAA
jgi:lipid-A-disaccharide synthase-like uncharacterized protein